MQNLTAANIQINGNAITLANSVQIDFDNLDWILDNSRQVGDATSTRSGLARIGANGTVTFTTGSRDSISVQIADLDCF